MAFNVLSQIFGSKKGHALNEAIDKPIRDLIAPTVTSVAQSLTDDAINLTFAKLGVPATPAGILQWADTELESVINKSTLLTETEKSLVIDTLNAVATGVASL